MTRAVKNKVNLEKNTVKKIKLKPIIAEVEIEGGSWKYVVLNENNMATAMFVDKDEAEAFKERSYEDEFTIREYDGEVQ